MKIFISPAKRLDTKQQIKWNPPSQPLFANQAKEVHQSLKELSPKELKLLMKISDEISEMNYERNQIWQINPSESQKLQAGIMFDGEVYRGLHKIDLSADAMKYMSENMMIISGLYGLLRLTDTVMPYRLEMGSRLAVPPAKTLYEFWKSTLTSYINSKTEDGEILLALASTEYMKVFDKKKLKGKIMDVKFMQMKNGKLKSIVVYLKQARGAMARFCAENEVHSLEQIKLFNEMDYAFDENLSDDKTLIFTR